MSIVSWLSPQDWFAAIGLQDVYLHIASKPYQKSEVFPIEHRITTGSCCFGLFALWVFSKCLAVIGAHLRRQGIQLYLYLSERLI